MIAYPEVVKNNVSMFQNQRREVSVDFEFRPPWSNPEITILGLSSGGAAPHSTHWGAEAISMLGELEEREVVWVGHNSLTTEKKIIEEELGLKQPIPLEGMEDTTIAGIWTKDVIG